MEVEISIHAPHTGRDQVELRELSDDVDISIHAPHTGRDLEPGDITVFELEFQSTRPIRGATRLLYAFVNGFDISIHAPHTGRDMESLDPTKSPY